MGTINICDDKITITITVDLNSSEDVSPIFDALKMGVIELKEVVEKRNEKRNEKRKASRGSRLANRLL